MQKQHLKLTEDEQILLKSMLSKGELNTRVQKRVLGLLELDRGKTKQSVKDTLGVSYPTVNRWCNKYKAEGLGFLQDKPRSGRPAEISGEQRGKITALACSKAPDGYGTWTLRLLADRVVELDFLESISHTEVSRILKKTNYNRT